MARREQLRKQQKAAHWRRKWLPVMVLAAVAVLALAWYVFSTVQSTQPIAGLETFPRGSLSRDHVPPPHNYPQVPPVGGPHADAWMTCGVYAEPVPRGQAVHSMEHGAAWITYRQELPEAEVQALRNLARGQSFVLLSPWDPDPPLPSPIVASAWGLQLKVDSTSDPRLADFIRRYGNGSQTLEPGATCTRGVGSPLPNP